MANYDIWPKLKALSVLGNMRFLSMYSNFLQHINIFGNFLPNSGCMKLVFRKEYMVKRVFIKHSVEK